jgi:hypothetical protein
MLSDETSNFMHRSPVKNKRKKEKQTPYHMAQSPRLGHATARPRFGVCRTANAER